MKNTLKLANPIMVNNQQVAELTYDTNEITGALFAEADIRRKVAAGTKNVAIVPAVEFDFGLHPYMGFAAVIAVNPQFDFSDLERIHGTDLIKLMEIGRNFLLKSEELTPEPTDEQSETTAKLSTQA